MIRPWLILGLIAGFSSQALQAGQVYETGGEFLTSGDFNGDGIPDVLVLDKLTGNARVGLADTGGSLSWSAPLVTGVANASGCAVGHWLQTTRDAVAVTSPTFNRVNLVDLSNTNAAGTPVVVTPDGLGPHTLAALSNPFGGTPPAYPYLLAMSSDNQPPPERLDLLSISAGSSSPFAEFVESGPFYRVNPLQVSTNPATYAVGLVRGTNDALHIWQFVLPPESILSLTNLPAGSDYTFGVFKGETMPRFLPYLPGDTNLTIVALQQSSGSLQFGGSIPVSVSEPIQHIYFLNQTGGGYALIQFDDGVQGLRLDNGVPQLASVYRTGVATAGNTFTGVVPLGSGKFALLDGPPGSASSVHAQVIKFDGTNYTQLSSSDLPSTSSSATRANVWLFHSEPFVQPQPGFIASLSTPDWSDRVSGLPGSLTVASEQDGGTASGLGSVSTNSLGSPPSGSVFGLPNQYRPDISLFSYSSPHAPEPVAVTIWPTPGDYSGPIQITFSNLNAGDQVFYRVGTPDAWHLYGAAFPLTNDATIQFYGTNAASPSRSELQTASYFFNNSSQPVPTLNLTNGTSTTNPPVPPFVPNIVTISPLGTVFYDRISPDGAYSIWTVNLDGSDDAFLTTGARPRVSRDGRYMAFLRDGTPLVTQGNLWVRDLQTGQESLLYTNFSYTIGYDWDTTGTNLVFDNGCSLWKISVNSGGMATALPLATDCNDDAPVVNPVDGRLAFHNLNPGTGGPGLFVTTPAVTNKTVLVSGVSGASWPAWSPDGQWIAFADGNNSDNLYMSDSGTNLWVVKADGSNLSQITSLNGLDDGMDHFRYGAVWSPDGGSLIGAGDLYGVNGIWIIPLTPDRTDCLRPANLLPTSPGDAVDFVGSVVLAKTTAQLPGLYIRRDSTDLVVYWSTNFTGYVLEYTTNLVTPVSWHLVGGPYLLTGINHEYHEPFSALARAKYFRLHYVGIAAGIPRLYIRPQGNSALLYWQGSYAGYILETTTNLGSPGSWVPVKGPYSVNGDFIEHLQSLPGAVADRYYRLRAP